MIHQLLLSIAVDQIEKVWEKVAAIAIWSVLVFIWGKVYTQRVKDHLFHQKKMGLKMIWIYMIIAIATIYLAAMMWLQVMIYLRGG